MSFVEPSFLLLLTITYISCALCLDNHGARLRVMLIASLVFYGYHQWELVLLILSYCLVDWWIAGNILTSPRPRLMLTLGIGFNLLVLSFWKYTPMLVRTSAKLLFAYNIDPKIPKVIDNWYIPFGISFYAFTGIAYMMDVYRRKAPAEANLVCFSVYLSFFPQLIAGPILRAADFLPKLQKGVLTKRPRVSNEALHLLARGYFKKMVLADRIGLAVDPFFFHVADSTTAGVWALPYIYLYAFQIYFDFSAYTDIARGLGLLFGFRWPENFNLPYLSGSIQEFWRRWHITLSTFLRDYLYIPLGGNRWGLLQTQINIMVTMLLGGLWHGANWSFVLWGALHGLFLIVNRLWISCRFREKLLTLIKNGLSVMLWKWVTIGLTFHCVCFAWCFFRITEFNHSLAFLRKCFIFDAGSLFKGGSADISLWLILGFYGLLALVLQIFRMKKVRSQIESLRYLPSLTRGLFLGMNAALLVLAIVLSPGGEAPPFLYFQF